MDLSALQLSWAGVSAVTASAALVGWMTWWIIRKRQNRVWLPTIRVLEIESRLLPKLQWQLPPLLPFLAFILASLAVVWFSFSPTKRLFSSFEPNELRYHIFLDMSPSVSAHVSLEEYASRFTDLWATLAKAGRVSVSSSLGPEFVTPRSLAEAKAYFENLQFHRAGVRLGAALKEQMEQLGKVDRLFLVSDADQHSWNDLNWEFLSNELDVLLVDLRADEPGPNVYINGTTFAAAPGAEAMDWEVELVRTNAEEDAKGVVMATFGNTQLASSEYTIPAGRVRQVVRVSWLAREQEQVGDDGERVLMFRVTTEQPDAILMDNQMRTQLRGRKQNAFLVAAPAGEMQLEDPTHHLQKSLQVLDFRLKRVDKLTQPGPEPTAYPFWLIVGGGGTDIDRFCPRSIETARLEHQNEQGAKSATTDALPTVWLIPENPSVNYQELCWCYARLVASEEPLQSMPSYCQDVVTRERYVGVLDSLGAQQVGGNVDDLTEALAFRSYHPDSGLQVVAFTIPLTPLRATGINHAALPVLVKDLLEFQGLLTSSSGRAKEEWPRIGDLVAMRNRRVDPKLWDMVQKSNVPAGESMIQTQPNANLPPRWMASGNGTQKQLPSKKDQSDPLPWIRLCALLIIAATLIEVLYLAGGFVRKLIRPAVILMMGLGIGYDSAHAEIKVNLLGYGAFESRYSNLAEEVSLRTSIDMNDRPAQFSDFTDVLANEPWVWVQNIGQLTESGGQLKPEVINWIKRGGFLVIEGTFSNEQLKKMTGKPFEYAPLKPGWQPIPPDHELMRSFHLLDSLPVCQTQVWQGFHFDGRLAILAIPYRFLESLKDSPTQPQCKTRLERERAVRVFVNLLMVVLATDYKKDQIHLPEILKRLR